MTSALLPQTPDGRAIRSNFQKEKVGQLVLYRAVELTLLLGREVS